MWLVGVGSSSVWWTRVLGGLAMSSSRSAMAVAAVLTHDPGRRPACLVCGGGCSGGARESEDYSCVGDPVRRSDRCLMRSCRRRNEQTFSSGSFLRPARDDDG